jgi:hypothetical protein
VLKLQYIKSADNVERIKAFVEFKSKFTASVSDKIARYLALKVILLLKNQNS